jgi:CheY-like chemotaxis protein/AraC-like DNA-binding protein
MLLRPEADGRRFAVTVRDTGEGIAAENLPRIFELYYTSAEGGMGIGLALTRQLVEEMGGTIAVASAPGRGTEFTVSLPLSAPAAARSGGKKMVASPDATGKPTSGRLASPDATTKSTENTLASLDATTKSTGNILASLDATAKSTENTLASPDATGSGGFGPLSDAAEGDKPVVLVVEDNRDVANYIATVLGGEYTVLYAADGVEGLEMAERHVPDLVITDVMMPRRDGYALTADIRASLATSHIPVIMLTAKATDGDRIEGIRTGADAYLAKPFNEQELLVRIEKLLENRARLQRIYSGALPDGNFGSAGADGADDVADRDRKFITRLLVVINSHIDDESYFPGKLSQDMCLSTSQLNRKLKAMTGDTISSFVMDVRLNKAKLLLSKGGQSIKEVAYACGFGNLGYFSRSFKSAFGCTPSQFMKTDGEE